MSYQFDPSIINPFTIEKPIPVRDADTLEAALAHVNFGARAFTVTSAKEVAEIADLAEQMLAERLVRRSSRRGARFTYVPPGPDEDHGGRRCVSIRLVLERGRTDWSLVAAEKVTVGAGDPARGGLAVTSAVVAQAVSRLTNSFEVIDATGDGARGKGRLRVLKRLSEKNGISASDPLLHPGPARTTLYGAPDTEKGRMRYSRPDPSN
jgi:hypothetical protein